MLDSQLPIREQENQLLMKAEQYAEQKRQEFVQYYMLAKRVEQQQQMENPNQEEAIPLTLQLKSIYDREAELYNQLSEELLLKIGGLKDILLSYATNINEIPPNIGNDLLKRTDKLSFVDDPRLTQGMVDFIYQNSMGRETVLELEIIRCPNITYLNLPVNSNVKLTHLPVIY